MSLDTQRETCPEAGFRNRKTPLADCESNNHQINTGVFLEKVVIDHPPGGPINFLDVRQISWDLPQISLFCPASPENQQRPRTAKYCGAIQSKKKLFRQCDTRNSELFDF